MKDDIILHFDLIEEKQKIPIKTFANVMIEIQKISNIFCDILEIEQQTLYLTNTSDGSFIGCIKYAIATLPDFISPIGKNALYGFIKTFYPELPQDDLKKFYQQAGEKVAYEVIDFAKNSIKIIPLSIILFIFAENKNITSEYDKKQKQLFYCKNNIIDSIYNRAGSNIKGFDYREKIPEDKRFFINKDNWQDFYYDNNNLQLDILEDTIIKGKIQTISFKKKTEILTEDGKIYSGKILTKDAQQMKKISFR